MQIMAGQAPASHMSALHVALVVAGAVGISRADRVEGAGGVDEEGTVAHGGGVQHLPEIVWCTCVCR